MLKYLVEENRLITRSTLLLTLRAANAGEYLTFQPGQYAAISFRNKGRLTTTRCFSLVSSPTQQDVLQFSMRVRGRYTKALASLQKGTEVRIRGPFGGFILDVAHEPNVVMLAGGIGITPFLSMIRYATAVQAQNRIVLLYSSQSQEDIPFLEELTKLQHDNPRFSFVLTIGDGVVDKLAGVHAVSGRISPELIAESVDGKMGDWTYFVCGPPPFMRGMLASLREKGVPESSIMTEAFSQGPNRQTGKIKAWPINVYSIGAVSLALSSVVVMAVDLIRSLPPMSAVGNAKKAPEVLKSNTRETDLDELVKQLTATQNTASISDAALQALAPPVVPVSQPSSQASSPPRVTGSPSPSPAPTAAPAPTPAPAPAPVVKPTPPPKTCLSGTKC